MAKLGVGSRILGFLMGLGLETLAYHLLNFWWNIYNRIYSQITPLQHSLSTWAFWGGIIVGFIGLVFLFTAIKGD